MQVAAFNTPPNSGWRWRMVNYAGETVAESRDEFPTIAAALVHGARHLHRMNVVDRSEPAAPRWRRSTSHLRS